MRCNNCGWINTDNESRCIKCNTELKGNNSSNTSREEQPVNYSGTIAGTQAQPLPAAASGEQAGNDTGKQAKEKGNATLISCPECAYIYSSRATVCPKCGRPNHKKEKEAPAATNPVTMKTDTGNYSGTIDPYRNSLSGNKITCGLTPVPGIGDKDNQPQRIFAFDDKPIELNRDNLDPGNKNITGKIQATIVYENGQWYLEDKSEQKTTFLQVSEKTALKEGDIIVMGDRKFIFNPESDQ